MELESLRIFLDVAECGSFTKAAKKLFISHSTTSRAVSSLEAELGVCLIDRGNHILGLTRAGELLQVRGRELLQRAEEISAELRAAAEL